MPSPLSLRAELAQVIGEARRSAEGKVPAVGDLWAADAVLGVLTTRIQQRLAALDGGAGAGGYYDPEEQAGARMELRELRALLGVAPATPEDPGGVRPPSTGGDCGDLPPARANPDALGVAPTTPEPCRYGDPDCPGGDKCEPRPAEYGAASLPTHDQEQPQ